MPATETWTYGGIRADKHGKRWHAWLDAAGDEQRFSRTGRVCPIWRTLARTVPVIATSHEASRRCPQSSCVRIRSRSAASRNGDRVPGSNELGAVVGFVCRRAVRAQERSPKADAARLELR